MNHIMDLVTEEQTICYMGSRPRINRVAVCSSYNYPQSRNAHIEYIREKHESNKEEIIKITSEIYVKTHAYVMCFGKRIEINIEEARSIEQTIKVIYE